MQVCLVQALILCFSPIKTLVNCVPIRSFYMKQYVFNAGMFGTGIVIRFSFGHFFESGFQNHKIIST